MIFQIDNCRAFIAIAVQSGMSCKDVKVKLNKALRKNAFDDRWIETLYKQFQDGTRTSTARCEGSGPPRTATDRDHEERLIELMDESRTWTEDELADILQISQTSLNNKFKKVLC